MSNWRSSCNAGQARLICNQERYGCMKGLNAVRLASRLAVGIAVAGLVITIATGSAIARSRPDIRGDSSASAQTSASAGIMKSARWITLRDGRKVWGVPLSLRLNRGRIDAHAASWGTCYYCSERANLGSGMCMSSYPNVQGPYVSEYDCNNSANQEWIYVTETDYMPYLVAYNSNNLCLNNWGFGFSNGNRMGLYSCNSASIAMWFVAEGSDWENYGYYLLHLYQAFGTPSNQCVTTLPGRPSGGPVDEWTCDPGSSWQAWGGLESAGTPWPPGFRGP